jgi:hypothetical protein
MEADTPHRHRRRRRRPQSSGPAAGGSGLDDGLVTTSHGMADLDTEQTSVVPRHGAGDDRAVVEAAYVDYDDEKTPTWAYVLCVLTFPVLLCFSFFFLFVKRSKRRRRVGGKDIDIDPDDESGLPQAAGSPPPKTATPLAAGSSNHHHHHHRAGAGGGHAPPLSPLKPLDGGGGGGHWAGGYSPGETTPTDTDQSFQSHGRLPPIQGGIGGDAGGIGTPLRLHQSTPTHRHGNSSGGGGETMLVTVEPSGSPRLLSNDGAFVETKRSDLVRLGNRVVLESVPPAIEGSLRAPDSASIASQAQACNVKFANRRRHDVVLFRLDAAGRRERIGVIRPMTGAEMQAPHRQPFIITPANSEDAIYIFVSGTEDCLGLID